MLLTVVKFFISSLAAPVSSSLIFFVRVFPFGNQSVASATHRPGGWHTAPVKLVHEAG